MTPKQSIVVALLVILTATGCASRYSKDPEVDKAVHLFIDEHCPKYKTLQFSKVYKSTASYFFREKLRWKTEAFIGGQNKATHEQYHVTLGGKPYPGVVFSTQSTIDFCELKGRVVPLQKGKNVSRFYPIPDLELSADIPKPKTGILYDRNP
jgi:hypothetical protein